MRPSKLFCGEFKIWKRLSPGVGYFNDLPVSPLFDDAALESIPRDVCLLSGKNLGAFR